MFSDLFEEQLELGRQLNKLPPAHLPLFTDSVAGRGCYFVAPFSFSLRVPAGSDVCGRHDEQAVMHQKHERVSCGTLQYKNTRYRLGGDWLGGGGCMTAH